MQGLKEDNDRTDRTMPTISVKTYLPICLDISLAKFIIEPADADDSGREGISRAMWYCIDKKDGARLGASTSKGLLEYIRKQRAMHDKVAAACDTTQWAAHLYATAKLKTTVKITDPDAFEGALQCLVTMGEIENLEERD